jgi:death-on-curing protein
MKKTLYLNLAETLELHTRLIERFGGKPGIRDRGLLESALMRPRTGYYETLTLQAAALIQSLALNHAFIDGNKRVAFAATAIFLKMNGFSLRMTADEGETFLIESIINQRTSLDEISRWLAAHIKAR